MSLVEFLKQNGYTQIPLSRSGVGHFHIEGLLNGHPVTVLVDTGADSTIFSLDLVREMNFTTTRLGLGAGAGSAELEFHEVHDASFVIGSISPKVRAHLAMDFSTVNQALAAAGSTPVDAILGIDVLDAHSAVIDYGSNSLYLRV